MLSVGVFPRLCAHTHLLCKQNLPEREKRFGFVKNFLLQQNNGSLFDRAFMISKGTMFDYKATQKVTQWLGFLCVETLLRDLRIKEGRTK